jgi:hypothetical protein
MEIGTWPLRILKSGEVSVLKGGTEAIRLIVEDRRIDINLQDTSFLRDLLDIKVKPEKKSVLKEISRLKDIAEELKKDGCTVTVSIEGKPTLKLGLEANPKLTRLMMLGSAIQVKNIRKLIHLFKELR